MHDDRSRAWEDRLAKPMFVLSLMFLAGMAAATHLLKASEEVRWDWPRVRIAIGGLLLLWPIFLIEAVVRYFLGGTERRTWKSLARCLAIGFLPPLRLAAGSRTRPEHIWLPWKGWRATDFDLQKTLERVFSAPMMGMALLILPVLAVEYFWSDAVDAYPLLRTGLGIAVGLIWLAFTVEFIVRISAADKKFRYAFEHWVDLAVVLIPMLEFMPFLRVVRAARLMRVQNLARLAKYYRMYGLAGKGWRGLVSLRILQQLLSRSPQARMTRLKSKVEEKQEEIRELQREIDYYQRRIQAAEQELAQQENSPKSESSESSLEADSP